MAGMLGAIRRAAAPRAAAAYAALHFRPVFSPIRRAAAPRAAVGRRCYSSPSSTPSDYEILLERVQEVQSEHSKAKDMHESSIAAIKKSHAAAKQIVRNVGYATMALELGFMVLAFGTVYYLFPESPSPTRVTADAAKATAEAAKATAEAAMATAEAAKTASEAAKTAAEAASKAAEAVRASSETKP